MDKGDLYKHLEAKADKRLLEDKISRDYFDSLMKHLEKTLQDVAQRADGQVNGFMLLLSKNYLRSV